jgi:hypothetical protein
LHRVFLVYFHLYYYSGVHICRAWVSKIHEHNNYSLIVGSDPTFKVASRYFLRFLYALTLCSSLLVNDWCHGRPLCIFCGVLASTTVLQYSAVQGIGPSLKGCNGYNGGWPSARLFGWSAADWSRPATNKSISSERKRKVYCSAEKGNHEQVGCWPVAAKGLGCWKVLKKRCKQKGG